MNIHKATETHVIVKSSSGHDVLLDLVDYSHLCSIGVQTLTCSFHASDAKRVRGVQFYADKKLHILARYLTNCSAQLQADHINRNPLDNRRENLRCVSRRNNTLNRTNKAKIAGTTWNKTASKWEAAIFIGGKRKYLGIYDTQEEAGIAYQAGAKTFSIVIDLVNQL